MDWTPMIGRRRPVEQDAVRILTVVHQLGERPGRRWYVDHESHLQHLDSLVRHPVDLAWVALDLARRRPELSPRLADLARRIRRLLATPAQTRHRVARRRPFEPGSWERWDDVLAYLGCRDLLQTELLADCGLRYRLTDRGARWLRRSVYPERRGLGFYRERCELLRAVVPEGLLRPDAGTSLADDLARIGRRLDALREEQQSRPEDDLLSRMFQQTLREPL